jgi:hypothetical protein
MSVTDGTAIPATIGFSSDDLYIDQLVDGGDMYFRGQVATDTYKTLAKFAPDGAAELYYAGNKTFETVGNGIDISSTSYNGNMTISMNSENAFFDNNSAFGNIILRTNAAYCAKLNGNGAAELYYAGTLAVSTTERGPGLNVVGALEVSGSHPVWQFDPDETMAANSHNRLPTQRAVRGFDDLSTTDLRGRILSHITSGAGSIHMDGRDKGEWTGFINQTDGVMWTTNATSAFSVSGAAGADYEIYITGQKITVDGATKKLAVPTPHITGSYYYYLDVNGDLQVANSFSVSTLLKDNAYIANVYWNAERQEFILLGNERHTIQWDWNIHAYHHLSEGTKYMSGLGLSSIVSDGDGDQNRSARFSANSGEIRDEDIILTISEHTSAAEIPVFYRDGAGGKWRREIVQGGYPVLNRVGGRLAWNESTPSGWHQIEVTDTTFVLSHIWASNDDSQQIIAIQGQAEYSTIADARIGATTELVSIAGANLPLVEFAPIGTMIYQTDDTYTNTPKARVRTTDEGDDYVDFRRIEGIAAGGNNTDDHGQLSGLGGDDHLHYILVDGSRNFTGTVGGLDPVAATDFVTLQHHDSDILGSTTLSESLSAASVEGDRGLQEQLDDLSVRRIIDDTATPRAAGAGVVVTDQNTVVASAGGLTSAQFSNTDVQLNYAGANRLSTTATGINLTDGTNTANIQYSGNNLQLINTTTNGIIQIYMDDNTGNQELVVSLDTDAGHDFYVKESVGVKMVQTGLWIMGGSQSIYTTITQTGANLLIDNTEAGGTITLQGEKAATGNSTLAQFDPDGAVTLYYAGDLATTTTERGPGLSVVGALEVSGSHPVWSCDPDETMAANTHNALPTQRAVKGYVTSITDALSSHRIIDNTATPRAAGAGVVVTDQNTVVTSAGGLTSAQFSNSAAELYYAGVKTLETYVASGVINGFRFGDFTSSGATAAIFRAYQNGSGTFLYNEYHNGYMQFQGEDTGGVVTNYMQLKDTGSSLYNNNEIVFGMIGDGFRIYNGGDGGSWAYAVETAANDYDMIITGPQTDSRFVIRGSGFENFIVANGDASVDLYYDGVIATSTTERGPGLNVVGALEVSGSHPVWSFDPDETLAADTHNAIPTQRAVKGYVDTITGSLSSHRIIDNTVTPRAAGAGVVVTDDDEVIVSAGGYTSMSFTDTTATLYALGERVFNTTSSGINVQDYSGDDPNILFSNDVDSLIGKIEVTNSNKMAFHIGGSSETMIAGNLNGNVALYYDNVSAVNTTERGPGLNVVGALEVSGSHPVWSFDPDGTLAADSHNAIPTQRAVKEFAANKYTYSKTASAGLNWNVDHNLGSQFCNVEVISLPSLQSVAGTYDEPLITFVNTNSLTVTFTEATSGYAVVIGGEI